MRAPEPDAADAADAAGGAAEAAGAGAFDALAAQLADDPDPQARWLLGGLRYADEDFAGARAAWEEAHRGFRRAGAPRLAARVAADLAELHWDILGNRAASRGWTNRARRLLAGEGRCVEQGYVDLAVVACEWTDLEALERCAADALALALEFGDPDLEVRALADGGYALVAQGRTEEGFAQLDEAMAALTAGEVTDLSVAGKCYCALLSACDLAGAAPRAEEWTRLVRELVLDRFGGRPKVLHTHCRLAYGSVLCTVGRWSDAEAALLDAVGRAATGAHTHQADAAARLAHLRVLEGRLDEAAELLAPHEDLLAVCAPLAELHLARDEPALAAAVLRRGLDQLVGDRLAQGTLLGLLVEAERRADVERAAPVVGLLAQVASECHVPVLDAQHELAAGRVAMARDDHQAALAHFGAAERALRSEERPVLSGTVHLERAGALAAVGDEAAAVAEARAALAVFERLGAKPSIDRTTALLRSLGARGRPSLQARRAAVEGLSAREREVLDLVRRGMTNAEIGAALYISAKTVEHHVGRLLAKLGVRSRAEAAAVAATLLSP